MVLCDVKDRWGIVMGGRILYDGLGTARGATDGDKLGDCARLRAGDAKSEVRADSGANYFLVVIIKFLIHFFFVYIIFFFYSFSSCFKV